MMILPSEAITRSWAWSLLPPRSVIVIPPEPKPESIVPSALSRATPTFPESLYPVTTILPSSWIFMPHRLSVLPAPRSKVWMPSPLKLVSRFPDDVKRATKKSTALPATTILPFASISMARMASHPPPRSVVHLPSPLNDVSSVPSMLRRASAASPELPTPTQPPTTIFPSDGWMAPALQSSCFPVLKVTNFLPSPLKLGSRLPSTFRTTTVQS